MKYKETRRALAFVTLALVSLALPAPGGAEWSAAEPEAPAPSLVTVYGGDIDFAPSVAYRRAVLTISGGDVVFRKAFAAGERPAIGLYDLEGNVLPDGVYTWELALLPDAETALELRKAASANGDEAPGAWRPESGSFAILGGRFVSPDVTEATGGNEGSTIGLIGPPPSPMAGRSAGFRAQDAIDADGGRESEADVRVAVAALDAARVPMAAAVAQARGGAASGDSDATAQAAGQSLEAGAVPERSAVQSRGAAQATRTIDPTGANGRPRSEKDLR